MATNSTTLYKLMVLYMLNKVNFPLNYAQISAFMLDNYTSYFTLQDSINDLKESEFIVEERLRNITRYQITAEGRDTLNLLLDQISPAIQEDICNYLIKNKYELRNEANITSTYFQSTSKDFMVQCQVLEAGEPLIELQLSVPDEDTANEMCTNWKEASNEIYEFVYKKLLEKKFN